MRSHSHVRSRNEHRASTPMGPLPNTRALQAQVPPGVWTGQVSGSRLDQSGFPCAGEVSDASNKNSLLPAQPPVEREVSTHSSAVGPAQMWSCTVGRPRECRARQRGQRPLKVHTAAAETTGAAQVLSEMHTCHKPQKTGLPNKATLWASDDLASVIPP